jgi:hypothetical protein
MTQAFNLSQLANNVNTTGQLNAAAGLYNQLPVANGGTGVATVASGNILVGAGTSAMTALAGTNINDVVTWNGSAWVSTVSQGGALQTYTVAVSPGTWTKPATLKGIKVTVIGGGGTPAGSLPASVNQTGAGSGGGGAAIRLYPAPSIPGPQPYTVGTAGNTSSFGIAPLTVISATGGASGGNTSQSSSFIQIGGLGGVGSNGNINVPGSAGLNALVIATTPAIFVAGAGGNSLLGAGGNGLGPGGPIAGNPGLGYGGGGGGQRGGPYPAGGTGASGVVIIEEFY